MNNRICLAVTLGALLLACAPALDLQRASAQEPKKLEFDKKPPIPGGGGFPGPTVFGPGSFFIKPLVEALDSDKDGKLSKDEVLAGVKKFFADCDKEDKGSLDEAQVAEGLNKIFPRPKGPIGAPGGIPGGPGGFPGGGILPGGPGGAGGALGGPPRPGDILPSFLQQQLKLTPEQKAEVEKLQKEVEAKLDKILTEEQRKLVRQMRDRFSGQPFPGFPGKGGAGFGKFGAGNVFASAIIRRADADKDGKVTLKEISAAAEAIFKDADKNKDGNLDDKELGAAIGSIFPAPAGFGPGGKGGAPINPPPRPGKPRDVKAAPGAFLADPAGLRTVFLEFGTNATMAGERNEASDVEISLRNRRG